ncbi:hypothetical protein QYZ45_00155, partial [Vibrio parahaemolyticus]|nr:hypothetical protein [Vibrio parahaemolyticus]
KDKANKDSDNFTTVVLNNTQMGVILILHGQMQQTCFIDHQSIEHETPPYQGGFLYLNFSMYSNSIRVRYTYGCFGRSKPF